jgi:hypothetical protein
MADLDSAIVTEIKKAPAGTHPNAELVPLINLTTTGAGSMSMYVSALTVATRLMI